MSTRISLISSLRMLSAGLVLCSTLPAVGANFGACRPSTPCPCAADGVCRPNSETWGHYGTQWRPWPGDVILQPQAAGPDVAGEDDTLKGFLPPTPRDEDLRGPAKDKEGKSGDDSGDGAPEGGEALPTLPGVELQGNQIHTPDGLQIVPLQLPIAQNVALLPSANSDGIQTPSQEMLGEDPFAELGDEAATNTDTGAIPGNQESDPPPALPKFLLLPPTEPGSNQLGTTSTTPQPVVQALVSKPAQSKPAQSKPRANPPVQQASWNQPPGIQLINPAAALVVQPSEGSLQQAIYFESTDLPSETPAR